MFNKGIQYDKALDIPDDSHWSQNKRHEIILAQDQQMSFSTLAIDEKVFDKNKNSGQAKRWRFLVFVRFLFGTRQCRQKICFYFFYGNKKLKKKNSEKFFLGDFEERLIKSFLLENKESFWRLCKLTLSLPSSILLLSSSKYFIIMKSSGKIHLKNFGEQIHSKSK